MKSSYTSIAITPNGRVYTKVASRGYEYVLVHSGGRELAKWSNSVKTLKKEIHFLARCGWDRQELFILGADISIN